MNSEITKMTDKEIEKALEVCPKITSAEDHCGECPYFQKHKDCIGNIEKDALDYINRLKAEKEQIRKETAKEILQKVYDNCDNLVADNSPDSNDFVDFARNTLVSELVKKYGVEVDE